MKKLLLTITVACITMTVMAQSEVVKDQKSVKKTSSMPQKVHNTFSKKKEHNGTKVKTVKEVKSTTAK